MWDLVSQETLFGPLDGDLRAEHSKNIRDKDVANVKAEGWAVRCLTKGSATQGPSEHAVTSCNSVN